MPRSLEDIQAIIASNPRFKSVNAKKALANYLDAFASRNAKELPELIVTARGKRSLEDDFDPTATISNLNHRANITKSDKRTNKTSTVATPRDVADFTPIVGDALAINDIYKDIKNRNYLNAGIGAGLFFLPNVVEKPLKGLLRKSKRYINKFSKNNKNKHYLVGDVGSEDRIISFDDNHTFNKLSNNKQHIQEIDGSSSILNNNEYVDLDDITTNELRNHIREFRQFYNTDNYKKRLKSRLQDYYIGMDISDDQVDKIINNMMSEQNRILDNARFRLVNAVPNENGISTHGFYNPIDGYIYLNRNNEYKSNNDLLDLLNHEFGHKIYNESKDKMSWSKIKELNEDLLYDAKDNINKIKGNNLTKEELEEQIDYFTDYNETSQRLSNAIRNVTLNNYNEDSILKSQIIDDDTKTLYKKNYLKRLLGIGGLLGTMPIIINSNNNSN